MTEEYQNVNDVHSTFRCKPVSSPLINDISSHSRWTHYPIVAIGADRPPLCLTAPTCRLGSCERADAASAAAAASGSLWCDDARMMSACCYHWRRGVVGITRRLAITDRILRLQSPMSHACCCVRRRLDAEIFLLNCESEYLSIYPVQVENAASCLQCVLVWSPTMTNCIEHQLEWNFKIITK